jgi:hypothetical protein
VLGYLLARAGIEVQILEKHADFLHDFRGDTVHPSTLELMHELGVLEDLLRLPHQRVTKVRARIGGDEIVLNDMAYLRTHCKSLVLMPQWHFLNFLATQGSRFPTFHLQMQTEGKTLIEENGRIAGIRAIAPDGPVEIRADLVVSADGRSSVLRERAGLAVDEMGADIDLLWMRLSKHLDDPDFWIHANRGKAFVTLDRGEYWQCGFVIHKGSAPEMQVKGIEGLRVAIVERAPFLYDRIAEVRDWNDAKTASGESGSSAPLVSSRIHLHWGCGARHVSGWRCRDQPCYPGRRRRRQHIGTTTPRRRSPHQSSGEITTPQRVSSQVHTAGAGCNSPAPYRRSTSPLAPAAVGSHNSAAPDANPLRLHRSSARTCGDARRLQSPFVRTEFSNP